MRKMFNANVEALARGESGGSWIMCSQSGNDGDHRMRLCSNCRSEGNYALDAVAFCN